MSDQRRTGAVISLEEIFRSREFGRRPARWDIPSVDSAEATDPPHLEQVFLSELFGHPEAIASPSPTRVVPITAPAAPALVLLPGGGDAARDFTRYRGAIGAVSGVAAAALVVAGMTSGTGSRSEQPTISAEGTPPGQGSSPGSGGQAPGPGGIATQPNTSVPATGGPTPVATGSSTGASPVAQLSAATSPASPAVVVATPPPAPVEVAPPPPAPTPPSGPSPGGGGSVLTPVFVTAGNTVSTVGATVTATSNDIVHAVPAASPVTGLVSNVGSTVTNLGQSLAGA